jgi:hypothetical protein
VIRHLARLCVPSRLYDSERVSRGDDPAFRDKECLLFGLRLIVSRQVQLTFEKR